MENLLDALKIAAAVLLAAFVINMVANVSDKGSELFKKSTEDVTNSTNTISSYYLSMYDEKTVGYEDFINAVQGFSEDFEIRYQTLIHQDTGVEYRIYPGTEKDNHVSVSTTSIDDLSSDDCINKDAKWYATIDKDDHYILFKQERD